MWKKNLSDWISMFDPPYVISITLRLIENSSNLTRASPSLKEIHRPLFLTFVNIATFWRKTKLPPYPRIYFLKSNEASLLNFQIDNFRQIKVLRRSQSSSATADIIKLFPLIGFCALCFYFPTKMLHLNAPFFPLKCAVSPKNVTKMLG